MIFERWICHDFYWFFKDLWPSCYFQKHVFTADVSQKPRFSRLQTNLDVSTFFHRFSLNFKHTFLSIFGLFGITYSASIFTSIFDLIFHGFGSQASSKWLPKLIPNPKWLPKMTPMWHCWVHKGPPTASKKHTFLQKVVWPFSWFDLHVILAPLCSPWAPRWLHFYVFFASFILMHEW